MIKDILHLKAPGNWINDPNGFIYYQEKYHLFYQYFPYAPAWGTMHWGHAVSEDLIHWEHLKTALFPTKSYDRNGIFSGSAVEKDGLLNLYYSAVRYLHENEENVHQCGEEGFVTSQAMITSKDGVTFDNWEDKRQIIPVITDDDVADAAHTRDPKVWKHGNEYYMVLGSTYKGEAGRVLFYKSGDGVKWDYVNQYQSKVYGKVLECPDIFQIDGSWVFTGSPMGITEDGKKYADQAVCALADFSYDTCSLSLPDSYQFMDYGMDLYASQTNIDEGGRRVMIAWMRMPFPVEEKDRERDRWIGMMCLPRVVEVEDGHICFRPHPNVLQYFDREIKDRSEPGHRKSFRVQTVLKEGEILDIGGYHIRIENDCLKTDRSRVFRGADGYRMESETPRLCGKYSLDIFVDSNLIEIFVNNGQYVVSNVVYDLGDWLEGSVQHIFAGKD